MRLKRTIKRYVELYRNPRAMFPGGPNDQGAQVLLYPNGEPEIWIKDHQGKYGFCITAGHGPAGFGLTVSTFAGMPQATVSGDGDRDGKVDVINATTHIEICQHHPDPHSQAFKRWYSHQETEADILLLGESYRRKA